MASKTNSEPLRFMVSDYIDKLYKPEDEAVYAIADLIEDLHKDKNMTAGHIISQSDIEGLICQFFKLLRASLPIIVGNTAYILGTLAEFEECRSKIIHILSLEDCDQLSSLDLLITLLDSDDPETLLNVTGTIGSLVESPEGRHFILSRIKCLSNLLVKVNHLLSSQDLWIASNAALIIARITIDEDGNKYLLNSPLLHQIIVNLVVCLSIDTAGRGMNAAFALGRIFDNGPTIEKYYAIIYKMKFIEKIVQMTECSEMAFVKNSCFCLSSIMGSEKGFNMVVTDPLFRQLVFNLDALIRINDEETTWFAILTLKIISKKPSGCKLLRKTENMLNNVKKCMCNLKLSEDIKKECQEIINNLTPLEKPPKPSVTLVSPYEVLVSWNYPKIINYLEINSFLYYKGNDDELLAYRGKKNEVSVKNLESNQKYEFYLKFSTVIEITIPSDSCVIVTPEDYPTEPTNLHVVARTSTQIKIAWDEPEKMNGTIKHYIIQTNKRSLDLTNDRSFILSGLQPETKYSFSVFAVNSCGRGMPVELEAVTLSPGAHAPDRPNVIMLGRSVAHLTWNPPEAPMGKIFRYDVKINQKTKVYSGINTYCKVTNLKADTSYSFSVMVVTSEGKYESPICRKKTGKDEYLSSHRAPLYECKIKLESGDHHSNQSYSPLFNKLPINSSKTQRNFSIGAGNSHNSEACQNSKSPPPVSACSIVQLPLRNTSNSEYLKQVAVLPKAANNESLQKLQPLNPFQYNLKYGCIKPLGDAVSLMSGYTNSISIPSLSSASLEGGPNHTRKSSETTVTNIKTGDKTTGLELRSVISHINGEYSFNDQSTLVDRCQFRKVPVKVPNDLINVPFKNYSLQTKNSILQRNPSKTFQ